MEPQQQAPPPRPAPDQRRSAVLVVLAVAAVWLLVERQVVTPRTVLILGVLFVSVILHEVSHGAVALRFGDDTAAKAGRLTLNPARHVDPFGTIVLPAILVLANAPPFGWAKPVPVNPSKMRDPRNHSLLVSLAGPAVNVVLALGAALVLRSLLRSGGPGGDVPVAYEVLFYVGVVNVVLAVFNLLPLPPLDGSAVVERLLPARWWPGYLRIRQFSLPVLLVLVLLLPGALSRVFDPALEGWYRLLR
ncbi:MAG TPA: site-2 protease family protein [Acidimicrobiales bacterium]|nr:site-2 protease family protein [Acidimicrobiales bacterium]